MLPEDVEPPRVLVAESSAEGRARLAGMVRAAEPGAAVIEVASGRQVFAAITGERPTLAFVSLFFDDLSGPEALAWARAQGGAMPSLVLMANQVVPRWVEVSQRVEAQEFLKLPLDPRDVAGLLAAHRRQRAPLRVLVVESSAQGRGLVRRVLARSSFALDVEETDGGRHALKMLRLSAFDAVLIEAALPGLNGVEVACQARGLAPDARIFLMAGGEADELARASRHFGVDFVLRKPFFARDIDLALYRVLSLRRPYLLNALAAEQPTGTLFAVEAAEPVRAAL